MICPNCGHRLVNHRTDRRTVGEREVVMQWSACPRCRHVALEKWYWVDPPAEKEVPQAGRHKRTVRLRMVKGFNGA